MQPGLLIRLRPLGAWRYGPAEGGHDSVDTLYRSDRLYSAVTLAMQRLGYLDEWLAATVHAAKPAVVLSSLFPFQGDTLYAMPPTTLWPPPLGLLHSPSPVFLTKIRWKTARFVPLSVIDSLITGQPILADQWLPDTESGCLLRRDRPSASPFRVVVRSTAAVDRLNKTSAESKPMACIEFEPTAGLWTVARFADSPGEHTWSPRLQAALRLLSDSGFGGGRSKGWGQTQTAEFQTGVWPTLLLPKLGRLLRTNPAFQSEDSAGLFWLLSLYSPAAADKVDWSGGNYALSARGGRVESHAGQGSPKKTVRMVNEGCVLASQEEPVGAAVDVSPDGFAHPVYRSGLALALRLPVVEVQPQEKIAVEEAPAGEAALDEEPAGLPTPPEAHAVERAENVAEAPPIAAAPDEEPSVSLLPLETHVTEPVETIEPLQEALEPAPAASSAEPPPNSPVQEPPSDSPIDEPPSTPSEPPTAPEGDQPSQMPPVGEPPAPAEPIHDPAKDEEPPHHEI